MTGQTANYTPLLQEAGLCLRHGESARRRGGVCADVAVSQPLAVSWLLSCCASIVEGTSLMEITRVLTQGIVAFYRFHIQWDCRFVLGEVRWQTIESVSCIWTCSERNFFLKVNYTELNVSGFCPSRSMRLHTARVYMFVLTVCSIRKAGHLLKCFVLDIDILFGLNKCAVADADNSGQFSSVIQSSVGELTTKQCNVLTIHLFAL